MTVHLVTFASRDMSRSAELCQRSAWANGVDGVVIQSPESFSLSNIYREDAQLFSAPRGCGYWAWKPLAVLSAMSAAADGSYVIYSDAGVEFINNVSHIIDRMDQDIFLFGNNWEHAHWCKRDVVEVVWPFDICSLPITDIVRTEEEMRDHDLRLVWHRFGKQVQASVIFFRVSDYTRAFVKEWLDWCLFEGGRLIDDSPSSLPNHPEFREHRHDQAILTTMAYREGMKLHAWPAVYNRFLGQEFVYSREGYPESDNYTSLFHHHRLRNSEFDALGITL